MNVSTDVWHDLISDMMLWAVGEGDRAGLTDENEIVEIRRVTSGGSCLCVKTMVTVRKMGSICGGRRVITEVW